MCQITTVIRHNTTEPLNSFSVIAGKILIQPETIFQPLQQNAFPRILLVRNQRGLNFSHRVPVNGVRLELRPELTQVFQALRSVDQVGVGNGIRCTRKQIRQTHLVAHAVRQDVEREIKRTGNLLQNTVQEFM